MSSLLQKHGIVYSTSNTNPPPVLGDRYPQEICLHLQIHETTWSTAPPDHIPDSHHLQSCSSTGLVPITTANIIPPCPCTFKHNAILPSSSSSPSPLVVDHRLVSPKINVKMGRKKMNISDQEEAGDQSKRKKQFKKNGSLSMKTSHSESKMETMIKLETEAKKQNNNTPHHGDVQAPNGFVSVRARRGQATDSHSLAERARREKISMRMKLLQSLVPGCDKITGKAHILDEIINYVQSLQNQVECLAAKLAFVDPMFNVLDPLTSTLPESQCCLEPPLSTILESSSTGQLGSFADIEPSSVSLILDQRSMVVDDGSNLYLGLVDQSEDTINQCGLVNLSTFQSQ
ncbi:hypothetical protein FNV43_RR25655 [Rhamnella rubrinervis]|uniref:BHLH domain-containing protein n=1 Tax=Rhamnella rubrinervis TaxID=2594499 RepID=A0A8K0DHF0_9ROSA|nr:hypothetical protein FNV43_RR25655 [Rhamnella rubrinervis]